MANNINNLKKKNSREKESIVATICIMISIALIIGVLIADSVIKQTAQNELKTAKEKTKQTVKITTEEKTKSKVNEQNKKPVQKKATSIDLNNFACPVGKKEITMAFSYNTTPIYSNTLMEYRSDHTGIDIKANIGDDVKASYDGTVEKIYEDNKLGYTVIINHSNGIKTQYSNLDKKIPLKVKETVKKGDIIGKVGNSASFEINDGEHIHFAIIKDNEYINPEKYIIK